MTRQWWTEILALVARGGGFGGCTLALDWDECSASEPCPVGSSCEGGACVLDDDARGAIVAALPGRKLALAAPDIPDRGG